MHDQVPFNLQKQYRSSLRGLFWNTVALKFFRNYTKTPMDKFVSWKIIYWIARILHSSISAFKGFLLGVFFKILGHLEEHTQTNAPNFPISLEWSSSKFTPNAGRTFKRNNKFLFSLKSPKNHNSLKPASNYEENLETISKHQF